MECRAADLLRLVLSDRPRPRDPAVDAIRRYVLDAHDDMPRATVWEPNPDTLVTELDIAIVDAITTILPEIPGELHPGETQMWIDRVGEIIVLPADLRGAVVHHHDDDDHEQYRPRWIGQAIRV